MAGVDDLKSYVESAVDYAENRIEGIIARGQVRSGSQLRFSQSAIDIGKLWESLRLQIFVVIEGSQIGFGERSVTSTYEAKKIVDDTIAFSKRLPESMFYAGVESTLGNYEEPEGIYDERIDDFVERSPEIVNAAVEAALSEGAKRVAGALQFQKESRYFRSSYGPKGNAKNTTFDLNVRAFQEELDYSGQGLACGTKPNASEKEMIEAGAHAGRLSKQAIGATQGEPGNYDLILSPTVAAEVLGQIPDSANPFMVLIGMSPLGDKIGEQLAREFVSVSDDPTVSGGLANRAFDFEGTPSKTTPIIEDGVLKSFLHNTSTAAMYETDTTGSSDVVSLGSGLKMLLPNSSNLVFNNGDHSLEELLDSNKPAIYVTCNWYTRFQNYQTGDFSTIPRDAMFLVEKGEMKPIKNLRISDNTLRMFSNIEAMGKDRKQVFWWEVQTPTFIPSIRVKDCTMSAATQ